MITSKLTLPEIHKQLSYDIDMFEKSFEFKDMLRIYRKEVIRTKKEELTFKRRSFVSDKFKNTWFMLNKAYIDKKTKNYSLDISYYTLRYLEHGGMVAYNLIVNTVAGREKTVVIFPQHFWERYRERFLKEDLKGFELVHYFFKNNAISTMKDNKERGEADVIGFCKDGLCLGVYNDSKEIITFKTYISKQEMSEIQQEIHADSMTLFEVENKISVHPAFRDHCMERPGMVREYLKKVLGLNL